MYKRYGRFRFRDYFSAWIAIVFFAVVVVIGLLTDIPYYLLSWLVVLVLYMVWSVYQPNSECFQISGDSITIIKGRKKQIVSIPSDPIFIVSYADVCTPIARRMGTYGNHTYMLKGRYAISILQDIPLETVFERLHQNYVRKYTNYTVEETFNDSIYVYSLVGDQEILNTLLTNRKGQIIIPETLQNQISIDSDQIDVHIDVGY